MVARNWDKDGCWFVTVDAVEMMSCVAALGSSRALALSMKLLPTPCGLSAKPTYDGEHSQRFVSMPEGNCGLNAYATLLLISVSATRLCVALQQITWTAARSYRSELRLHHRRRLVVAECVLHQTREQGVMPLTWC